MKNSEVLQRNMLLNDIHEIKPLGTKAMTETLLMRVHYGKATEAYYDAQKKINEDKDADEEARKKAMEDKFNEDVDVKDKRMSRAAYEQLVESAMKCESIKTFMYVDPSIPEKDPDNPDVVNDRRLALSPEHWLTIFAANLVEE